MPESRIKPIRSNVLGFDPSYGKTRIELMFDLFADTSRDSEEIKKLSEDITKYYLKDCFFTGEYVCKIIHGKIKLPGDKCLFGRKMFWYILEIGKSEMKESMLILSCDECDASIEGMTILNKGECKMAEDKKWILPKTVVNFLSSKFCTWVGKSEYAEIIPCENATRSNTKSKKLKSGDGRK